MLMLIVHVMMKIMLIILKLIQIII